MKKKLTYSRVRRLIKKTLFSAPDPGMCITLYTGFWGMIEFDLCMMGVGSPQQFQMKQWKYLNKKRTLLVISLEKKEGPLKVVLDKKKYNVPNQKGVTVRYGTVVLHECGTFEKAFEWVYNWRGIPLE